MNCNPYPSSPNAALAGSSRRHQPRGDQMDMNKRHAGVFLGSLLAAAVLSGVAAAGNPHGAAPGQTKHSSTASASVSGKATARGRAKHQSSVTTSTSAAGNATGVKSSSTTRFNMSA